MNSPLQQTPRIIIHMLMLLMVALIASSFPVGALITTALPPEVMMFIRFLLAALMFAPYVFIKNGWHRPTHQQLLGYAVLSIPLVVFFWCMFAALRYTSALNTGAIYTTVPAMTAFYVFLINREKTSKRRAAGLLLGTLGALWIIVRGDISSLLQLQLNRGDLLFILGCLFMGAYNPLIRKLYAGEPMEIMTFWVISIGSFWLLLLSLPSLGAIEWRAVDMNVYLGILYLAIFTTLVSFFLLQLGTLILGATQVAAYSFLTPLFVVILNILMGSTSLQWPLIPGMVLVIIAMLLVQKEQRSPHTA
ncbi:DMT family transporter [Amphritea sp. 2_MG-2023]|uniref:DMT family transporter n=1 Tax=Amphritea TaxID=515417 RepID=UPI001C06CACF|nr:MULTISPECIES: DMT family transporter [Amphritea]MBU2966174.1 DMT family transporter [Amphritea atlantica]MDO6420815.1 DMT family transporter [Amphritea sp. 2_MG-2023]